MSRSGFPGSYSDAKPSSKAETRICDGAGGPAGLCRKPASGVRQRMQDSMSGSKSGGAIALLLSRRFGPLWVTQFLSAFNDNALKNALVLMLAYRPELARGLPAPML